MNRSPCTPPPPTYSPHELFSGFDMSKTVKKGDELYILTTFMGRVALAYVVGVLINQSAVQYTI